MKFFLGFVTGTILWFIAAALNPWIVLWPLMLLDPRGF